MHKTISTTKPVPFSPALMARLAWLAPLNLADYAALHSAVAATRSLLLYAETGPSLSIGPGFRMIQQGYAYVFRGMSDGRRQIIDVLLPGDICPIVSTDGPLLEHGICALTPLIYSEFKRAEILQLCADHPLIAAAFNRLSALNQAMLHERIISLGLRQGKQRLAHFLSEVFVRSRIIGQTSGNQCVLPLSQHALGDLLGLSLVHVNRSLQTLQGEGLVTMKNRLLTIHDFAALQAYGDFNPQFLGIGQRDDTTPVLRMVA